MQVNGSHFDENNHVDDEMNHKALNSPLDIQLTELTNHLTNLINRSENKDPTSCSSPMHILMTGRKRRWHLEKESVTFINSDLQLRVSKNFSCAYF